jgi:hypothetical protein
MRRIVMVSVVACMVALNPADTFAKGKPVTVTGAGIAILTDPALNLESFLTINPAPPGGEYPLAFAIAGVVRADGTASGAAEFVFSRPFAQVFDADVIFLSCKITGGKVHSDGTVTLTGISHERDFVHGQGLVFEEIIPFEIVITDDGEFTLHWCELPGDFAIEVTRGRLSVR